MFILYEKYRNQVLFKANNYVLPIQFENISVIYNLYFYIRIMLMFKKNALDISSSK